ncbi:hypothetical protein [Gordonia insulae]|uniref:Polyketide cyclase / dehydrase and lipid transport n=1 Tax=Gordonia insulae TaxID=2420509 RepID=A0A3G8JSS6_9ACTN|nr:hypothetical protein [Gordonia insulae]AZG48174.1 hypothetical protein D7316_04791 [Gordonia insulae]
MSEPPEDVDDGGPGNTSDDGDAPGHPVARTPYRPTRTQWSVAGAIAAFGVGYVLYHVLKGAGLGQSAALYVGIPLVLAVVITLSSPARRPAGIALKVTTILLLLSIPVLGEGACCVLMAAPIFYLFVYLGGRATVHARDARGRGPAVFVAPVLLALLAREGTTPVLTVPGDAMSAATRVVDIPAAGMSAALAAPLRFADTRPRGVLAIGFPQPLSDSGGLTLGGHRTIGFDGAHHRSGPVAQHHWGEHGSALELEVSARTASSVTFTPVADSTPLASWLRWREMRVSWRAVDATRTEVRWELHYTRLLSPAWYFGPIERVVTSRAADHLIRAVDDHAPAVRATDRTHVDHHRHR